VYLDISSLTEHCTGKTTHRPGFPLGPAHVDSVDGLRSGHSHSYGLTINESRAERGWRTTTPVR